MSYKKEMRQGVIVHDIPRIYPSLFSSKIREINNNLFRKNVEKIIKNDGIDVVVGCFLSPVPDFKNILLDVSDDHSAYWEVLGRSDYASEIDDIHHDYIEKDADVVVMGNVMKERLGIECNVIPNPVDIDLFSDAKPVGLKDEYGAEKIIGYFQNHDHIDRMKMFLDSVRMLNDKNIHSIIAGRGNAIKFGKMYVKKQGLTNVHFLGYLPFSEIPSYTKSFDVVACIFPKNKFLDAACPMNILEAIASGKNAVCSSCLEAESWGMENIYFTGYDPSSIALSLQQALESKPTRSKRILDFDLKELSTKYEKTIESSCN